MSVAFVETARTLFAEGAAFGEVGTYRRIDGRAEFALDPDDPGSATIFDLALAPRDADGRVRFSLDVFVLAPADPARADGTLLVEFPNRGNKRVLQFFNDAPATNDPCRAVDAGNGFLMRRGACVAVVAWQGDVLRGDRRLLADLPVARDGEAPVTARVRAEFIVETPGVVCLPLSAKTGTRSLPTVSRDPRDALFVRRRYPDSAPEPIPAEAWEFCRVEGGGRGGAGDISGAEQAILPSEGHVYLPRGFEPGWIYELTYTARDPLVLDLGFAGLRDLVAFFRREAGPSNPLAGMVRRAYGWGRSQSGRAIRDFIHRGFNDDGCGGRVFDGMLPHVSGAGRTAMNRFSNLVIAASRAYEDHLNPSDRFPFAYAVSRDHVTGAVDGILKRPATDPRVIHTHTASEYWYRRGSLVHTDTQGQDLDVPDGARVYVWSSSQHWSDPVASLPPKGVCANLQNIVATAPFFRAMLVLMEAWVRDGVAPPPSRVPRRADGTLVPFEAWRASFPAIPGVALPRGPNALPFADYGPDFATGGPAAAAPAIDEARGYAVLVPATDADGNDLAGLRAPMVSVPLATYTGWNLRIAGHGGGALHDFSGSTLPFAETVEERDATGDPRPAILERFADAGAYQAAIGEAARRLAAEGFLVPEDVPRLVAAAAAWGHPRHVVRLPAGPSREPA